MKITIILPLLMLCNTGNSICPPCICGLNIIQCQNIALDAIYDRIFEPDMQNHYILDLSGVTNSSMTVVECQQLKLTYKLVVCPQNTAVIQKVTERSPRVMQNSKVTERSTRFMQNSEVTEKSTRIMQMSEVTQRSTRIMQMSEVTQRSTHVMQMSEVTSVSSEDLAKLSAVDIGLITGILTLILIVIIMVVLYKGLKKSESIDAISLQSLSWDDTGL